MSKTLKEIARHLGGEVIGDAQVKISGVAGIKEALPGDLTFLANPKYQAYLQTSAASAIIASREVASCSKPMIRVDNPSLAFTKAVAFIFPQELKHFNGVSAKAVLGKAVSLGKDVAIGACAVIEDGVCVGDKTIIYPGCYIGSHSKIGSDCLIYANVSIREQITIANRVIIHSGTVIGSDGFGFVSVEGKHHKIPQVGTVEIADDVEIGANVTIDRARFDKTVIGKGTKIDNLVQIAHNVVIGENCLIVAQVGISGSVNIGNNVILAGQAGVSGHLSIGNDCIVMGKAGVTKDLAAGSVVWGFPARAADEAKKIAAHLQNLPKMYETLKELKKKIEDLEKNG